MFPIFTKNIYLFLNICSFLWKEQCEIPGCGRVDFAIYMPPDNKILPMDSKFSLPEDFFPEIEMKEGELVFMNNDQRKKANSLVINRTKEIIKYINPSAIVKKNLNFSYYPR